MTLRDSEDYENIEKIIVNKLDRYGYRSKSGYRSSGCHKLGQQDSKDDYEA